MAVTTLIRARFYSEKTGQSYNDNVALDDPKLRQAIKILGVSIKGVVLSLQGKKPEIYQTNFCRVWKLATDKELAFFEEHKTFFFEAVMSIREFFPDFTWAGQHLYILHDADHGCSE